ncbi:MAG: DegT/DnrJ/EryC1/StrS family aminotransferase [Cuspidothrix sp.]
MSIPLVDLKAQYLTIKSEIDAAISDVINNTSFIGGKYVKQFEEQFAAYIGTKYCVGCANGTDAIEILLKALGISSGDEVIVPAHTWISTAEAVTTIGGKPIFVDTHPDFYTIDVSKIEAKITPKTKAIIPVHLYGLPVEMDEIMRIAKQYNLKVIEDCAQAHGAMYKGQKIGTFGDGAAFSFFPGKNLGAYGDAGGMVTNNEEIAVLARKIANHGRLGKYDHEMEGRNSRLDSLHAAILTVKLNYLEQWTEARRHNANLYNKHLSNSNLKLPIAPDYSRHVYHLYVVQVENRDKVQENLHQEGIATGIHYPLALPMLTAYSYLGHQPQDFPVSVGYTPKILSLPMYPELTEDMIVQICTTLKQANQL